MRHIDRLHIESTCKGSNLEHFKYGNAQRQNKVIKQLHCLRNRNSTGARHSFSQSDGNGPYILDTKQL